MSQKCSEEGGTITGIREIQTRLREKRLKFTNEDKRKNKTFSARLNKQ